MVLNVLCSVYILNIFKYNSINLLSDGGERTGIYLATLDLITRIENGEEVADVFGTVKSLMAARQNIIHDTVHSYDKFLNVGIENYMIF